MTKAASSLTAEEKSVLNILTYGSVAARQELYVQLIYMDKAEVLQKIYDSMPDADYWRYVVHC